MHMADIFRNVPALLAALLIAILFLNSGPDKVFDWKGNLGWLTGHFSKTFLAPMVPLLLGTITAMELATGLASAIGVVYLLTMGSTVVIFYAAALGSLS